MTMSVQSQLQLELQLVTIEDLAKIFGLVHLQKWHVSDQMHDIAPYSSADINSMYYAMRGVFIHASHVIVSTGFS